MQVKQFLAHMWLIKPIWMTLLAFLLPIKLLFGQSEDFVTQARCAYIIVVMAVLWLTEALPIPMTSLLPVFMCPLLGVATAKQVASDYVTDTTMLFLGGLIVAVALEETGLHIRISLCVMMVVGAQPVFLMAGLMATAFFLSMWISNTAATSMMLPIIAAVIKTVNRVMKMNKASKLADLRKSEVVITDESVLDKGKPITAESIHINLAFTNVDEEPNTKGITVTEDHSGHVTAGENDATAYELSPDVTNSKSSKEKPNDEAVSSLVNELDSPEIRRIAKAFTISVAYGANIGGIATLTGSAPNLVLKENVDELYISHGYNGSAAIISYANWLGFALPLALITGVSCWLMLCILFIRGDCCKRMPAHEKEAINKTIREQFKSLGMLSLAEIQVVIVFLAIVCLWLFRAPPNMVGWGDVSSFKPGFLSDSTPCLLLGILLFFLPKTKPNIFRWAKGGPPTYDTILTWHILVNKMPWGVILLLGGGFSIANAAKESGLSQLVGDAMVLLASLEDWLLNLVLSVIVAFVTEVTSNTATATLLMPILSQLGIASGIHPLYLMIAAAVGCSFAFMLPVATPPNSIVFSTGYISVGDLVAAGLPMNIIALITLTLAINTWAISMWDMNTIPPFFQLPKHATPSTLMNTTMLNSTMFDSTTFDITNTSSGITTPTLLNSTMFNSTMFDITNTTSGITTPTLLNSTMFNSTF